MARISELKDKPKELPVPFGDIELKINYRPVSYTIKEMRVVADSKDPAVIAETMKRLVVSWDLEDDDGVVALDHPLTDDGKVADDDPLLDVPSHIFNGILKAVAADQAVSGEAGKP